MTSTSERPAAADSDGQVHKLVDVVCRFPDYKYVWRN
jgi:hypothetical protein